MNQYTPSVLAAVADERDRQRERWGEQDYPDGTGPHSRPLNGLDHRFVQRRSATALARAMQDRCDGHPSPIWRDILLEEVFEALAEDDPYLLRAELVQVAAVAVAWVEALDIRLEHTQRAWAAAHPRKDASDG